MTQHMDKIGAVAIIGAGITGVQAALDLADMGFKVYLLEKTPAIGGVMAQLDKTFPTNDCSMCILSPKLVDCARHPNIEIHTTTEITGIEGAAGKFSLKIHQTPRYVDLLKCTSCGSCAEICPVSLPNEFDYGLSTRKAIYKSYPQAIPNAYVIDKIGDGKHRCVECGRCEKVCKSGAIVHEQKPLDRVFSVGAVIVAAGAQPFDPIVKPEFGYKRYSNVVTSIEFERILSASGPFQGKILRPSDKKEPKRIAWVHCVGSRDKSVGNDYCSSMCCMYTAKEAVIAKEHHHEIEPTVFYIDVRSFGKDFDAYIERAKKEHDVRYVRSRISEVEEDSKTKNLKIRYEDECGELHEDAFDLVVLSVGLCAAKHKPHELVKTLGLSENVFGFVDSVSFDPVVTNVPGIFIAGTLLEPQGIPESVTQASAAAAKAGMLLRDVRGTLVSHKTYPLERSVEEEMPRIGVFICHCGINIGGVLDIDALVTSTKSLENVVYVDANLYSCSEDTQKKIVDAIHTHQLNRILVAACTPRTHEPLFQKSLREAGLNPYLLEMTNIREQCSWVHMDIPKEATGKAKILIAMAVAKTRQLVPIHTVEIPVNQRALVVGGGIAGMSAALSLADQGFDTVLVEKDHMLGGHLNNIFYTVEGLDVHAFVKEISHRVMSHPRIKLYLSSKIKDVKGYVGNYDTYIETSAGVELFNHGVVVVATGVEENKPKSYHYGADPRVMTQSELEKRLSEMDSRDVCNRETYVMIQCVESRDNTRPYCSRICCMQAVKNALRIKSLNPRAEVFVLYRDMMTYGFKEIFYSKARESGVVFIQYDSDWKPEISLGEHIKVKVKDPLLGSVDIPADYLILSTGMQPPKDTMALAKQLKVPLNSDGFFLEAHVKLRPVDFSTRGVFLAGCCHSPKFLGESVYQGEAAAARAATILASGKLESEPNIAVVDETLCSGCKTCILVCPYKAIDAVEKNVDGKRVVHAKVNEGLCQGCGTCVVACPARAIEQHGFNDRQILSMIKEII
ncbi:MAG: CoB--CoM heterodisulfide reductase iron-sulfur subunit A family protein [Euryarchaeota archaeon]|nr:CoB--CoM heterodisulfide reductase iron-sulfur subunit A family protein [Euryarchaeota archaeon]